MGTKIKRCIVIGETNGKQIRKYVYGNTLKEVEKKINDLKYEMKHNLLCNDKITFGEITNKWYQLNYMNKSYNTQIKIKRLLNKHLIPRFGSYPVISIKKYQVELYLNEMISQGYTELVRLCKNTIHAIFDFCVDNDYIPKNVCDNIKVQKFKQKNPHHSLNNYEKSIIEHVASYHRAGQLILTMLYTGMRREEVVALTGNDISENSISINKAFYFEKNNIPVLKCTKNGDSRTVPILYKIRFLTQYCGNAEYIFQKIGGGMMSATSFRNAFESFTKECNKYADAQGTEHIHFNSHDLRHTYCTMLYYANVGIKQAQKLMGHRTQSVTLNIYTHLDEEQEENIAQKLDNFIAK